MYFTDFTISLYPVIAHSVLFEFGEQLVIWQTVASSPRMSVLGQWHRLRILMARNSGDHLPGFHLVLRVEGSRCMRRGGRRWSSKPLTKLRWKGFLWFGRQCISHYLRHRRKILCQCGRMRQRGRPRLRSSHGLGKLPMDHQFRVCPSICMLMSKHKIQWYQSRWRPMVRRRCIQPWWRRVQPKFHLSRLGSPFEYSSFDQWCVFLWRKWKFLQLMEQEWSWPWQEQHLEHRCLRVWVMTLHWTWAIQAKGWEYQEPLAVDCVMWSLVHLTWVNTFLRIREHDQCLFLWRGISW